MVILGQALDLLEAGLKIACSIIVSLFVLGFFWGLLASTWRR